MCFSAVSSLSSKLASRAKHFVEETPEKASSHFPTRSSTVDLTSSPKKVTTCDFFDHLLIQYTSIRGVNVSLSTKMAGTFFGSNFLKNLIRSCYFRLLFATLTMPYYNTDYIMILVNFIM